MRTLAIVLLVSLPLFACEKKSAAPPAGDAEPPPPCETDADCAVSVAGASICACCPSAPHAVTAERLKTETKGRQLCGGCSGKPSCPPSEPANAYSASCVDKRCNIRKN
jgi:hypothetical protein